MKAPSAADIRAFRGDKAWTQADLASALGVSVRAIQEWEGDRHRATPVLALALAALALGLAPWSAE